MALYAHRDGYNVLHGDGSAKWHGDPQQSIVWYDVYYPSAGGGKPAETSSNMIHFMPGILAEIAVHFPQFRLGCPHGRKKIHPSQTVRQTSQTRR
jgi:hypothetical protein